MTMAFENIQTIRNTEASKAKEESVLSITINETAEDGWYKRSDNDHFDKNSWFSEESEVVLYYYVRIK